MSPIGKILLSLCVNQDLAINLEEATLIVSFMLKKHREEVRTHVRLVSAFLELPILN